MKITGSRQLSTTNCWLSVEKSVNFKFENFTTLKELKTFSSNHLNIRTESVELKLFKLLAPSSVKVNCIPFCWGVDSDSLLVILVVSDSKGRDGSLGTSSTLKSLKFTFFGLTVEVEKLLFLFLKGWSLEECRSTILDEVHPIVEKGGSCSRADATPFRFDDNSLFALYPLLGSQDASSLPEEG